MFKIFQLITILSVIIISVKSQNDFITPENKEILKKLYDIICVPNVSANNIQTIVKCESGLSSMVCLLYYYIL